MSVPAAYITVILIWSTTPLAINWSVEGLSPLAAVGLRMLISAFLGLIILRIWRVSLPWHHHAMKSYIAAVLGIFFSMTLVYWSALYVSSGMISVFFGLSPLLSGLMAQRMGLEARFTAIRWLALWVALGGLGWVFFEQLSLDSKAAMGMSILLASIFLFSVSNVWVKQINAGLHPMAQTVGSLLLSLPLYALAMLVVHGINGDIFQPTERALWAVGYLAIGGSLLGFACYFFILHHLSASRVALVTLITPVIALWLGVVFNDETLTAHMIMGTMLIGIGLGLFHWGDRVVAWWTVATAK